MVTELLRLQQEKLLPPEVTAEDMTNLLLEQGKNSLRVQSVTLRLALTISLTLYLVHVEKRDQC